MRPLMISLLTLAGGAALAADPAPAKTTPLTVNPVVLPTPEVQTQALGAAPEAPAPKAAAKKARPAPKKAAKKVAKRPAAKKRARR